MLAAPEDDRHGTGGDSADGIVCLRDAAEADEEFLYATYVEVLRAHVEWAWGWDDTKQRLGFRENLPLRQFQIITVAGRRAGAMLVQVLPSEHVLRLILLRPEHQGRGIGSALVRAEIARARLEAKPLTLKVIKSNPAKRLYDRLGFEVRGEDRATWELAIH